MTIKQMTAVSAVAVVTLSLFIVIQLFHFVQQRREDYARQLESIAFSVREPLAEAVLRADVVRVEAIRGNLQPVAFLSRARLPANVARALPERTPGACVAGTRIQITHSYRSAAGDLVLQADSYRMFQFIIVSTFSMLLATYFLLTLILSVAVTWCINA
ncbi:MAG: hypothetical protein ACR5LF_04000 [Symbiopectobacterium sp.]